MPTKKKGGTSGIFYCTFCTYMGFFAFCWTKGTNLPSESLFLTCPLFLNHPGFSAKLSSNFNFARKMFISVARIGIFGRCLISSLTGKIMIYGVLELVTRWLYENFSARVFVSINQGLALHPDVTRYHLSLLLPLYVTCNFSCSKRLQVVLTRKIRYPFHEVVTHLI